MQAQAFKPIIHHPLKSHNCISNQKIKNSYTQDWFSEKC